MVTNDNAGLSGCAPHLSSPSTARLPLQKGDSVIRKWCVALLATAFFVGAASFNGLPARLSSQSSLAQGNIAPAGPLSDLFKRVLADDDAAVDPLPRWMAKIFNLEGPGKELPVMRMIPGWSTDKNGTHLTRTIRVCQECSDLGWIVIFTERTETLMRLYLTYTDGKLRKVYDAEKGGRQMEVININDDVKGGFEKQVNFWKEVLKVK